MKTIAIVLAVVAVLAVGAFAFGNPEARAALEAGDYDGFVAAHAEKGWRHGEVTEERFLEMQERHGERQAHHEAVKAAMDAGDYEAWQAAMGDHPKASLTEEQFQLKVEMHQAMQDGDFERAKELRSELGGAGFGCPGKGGFGKRWH